MFDEDRTSDAVEDVLSNVEEFFDEIESMAEDARGVRKRTEGEQYTVAVDVPGFEADELEVTVKEHLLLVTGETNHGGGQRKTKKRIPLHGDLEHGEATAQVDKGVLTVRIPFADEGGTHIDVS